MNEVTRKYVVARDLETKKLIVDVTPTYKFHADIFGEHPEGLSIRSAGYYTVVTNDQGKIVKLHTHGNSVGFQIGPHRFDALMLRAFEEEGEHEFDVDQLRAQWDEQRQAQPA